MGDMGEYWADVKPMLKEISDNKKKNNKEKSTQILKDRMIPFESHNNGIHLVVYGKIIIADFWPSTGKFIIRGGKKGRGVYNLLKEIEDE